MNNGFVLCCPRFSKEERQHTNRVLGGRVGVVLPNNISAGGKEIREAYGAFALGFGSHHTVPAHNKGNAVPPFVNIGLMSTEANAGIVRIGIDGLVFAHLEFYIFRASLS